MLCYEARPDPGLRGPGLRVDPGLRAVSADIVDLLLKGKANPALKDSRGKTASDIGKEQCAESKSKVPGSK